jgi:hypothetical protein
MDDTASMASRVGGKGTCPTLASAAQHPVTPTSRSYCTASAIDRAAATAVSSSSAKAPGQQPERQQEAEERSG